MARTAKIGDWTAKAMCRFATSLGSSMKGFLDIMPSLVIGRIDTIK